MLNTEELFKLARIVETGSFVLAASELGVSQPALSKTVAKLERKLGARLLERRARGVVPTAYAEALLRRALPAMAELRAAELEIEAMRGGVGGTVTVGLAPAVAISLLPRVVKELRATGRAISLRVVEGLADELIQGVRTGRFLREIDKVMPAELDIHCICDNYATHSHLKTKAWLATDKAIRRNSFTSVKQLVQRTDHFVAASTTNCQPFKWTATADSILLKLHRLCSRISGTGH